MLESLFKGKKYPEKEKKKENGYLVMIKVCLVLLLPKIKLKKQLVVID